MLIILGPTAISRSLAGRSVDVCEYPDDRLEIGHGERALPYRVSDKLREVNQAAIVDKALGIDACLSQQSANIGLLDFAHRGYAPC